MAWRIASGVIGLLFVLAAAVQYNDPDPLRWMAIYGAAAIASGLSVAKRQVWVLPAVIAAVALVWALTIAPRVIGSYDFRSLFGSFGMAGDALEEEAREMCGLGLVALWSAVLAVASRPLRRPSA